VKKGRTSRTAISARGKEQYVLRLYVAGLTPRSRHAIANITSICEEYLQGRYDLEVIDVFKRPVLAREEQIVATPTLVKKLPAPLRRLIGDLSEREKVLIGLDVRRQG
jgi:circadian clock protein KaiB